MKEEKNTYNIIGVMSGTSIDGLDLAYCAFERDESHGMQYSILQAETIPYSDQWISRLTNLSDQSAEVFAKTDVYYGHLIGQEVNSFITRHKLNGQVDFVSSHGQTIFHNPQKSYTVQIGHGSAIAKECGLPVVNDLRTTDMAYGGQGAPIVPVGERDLFPDYRVFINLGGITNIQFHGEAIEGYDVCSANILLDRLANLINLQFDQNGHKARQGQVNAVLLHKLNSLAYFAKNRPKTLHADDVIRESMPLILSMGLSVEDSLSTVVEHIAEKINLALEEQNVPEGEAILVTGGGAFNSYLMERIQMKSQQQFVIPDDDNIIKFKEALIMAYMGLLRWEGKPNVIHTVTGATKDTCNGCIYLP